MELWHYDSTGNQVCTSLRKRIHFMEGIRKDGLQLPRKEKQPDGQPEMDLAFDGNVVLVLMKDQAAETHPLHTSSVGDVHLLHTNGIWDLLEVIDDNTCDSSGSMSPCLGVMWREGCPKSPDWEGDVELGSEGVEEDNDVNNLCIEGPRGGKGKKA